MKHCRGLLSAIFASLLTSSAALAQASGEIQYVSYVSASGTGSACTMTAPCANFDSALYKTFAGGSIICLTPGNFGGFSITKGITIDCGTAQGVASFSGAGGQAGTDQGGIFINVSSSLADRAVRIRGVGIQQSGGSTHGILIVAASSVTIEDSAISRTNAGIFDRRGSAGGSTLFIRNTVIRDTRGPSVISAAGATSGTVIENSSLLKGSYGLAAASGNNVVVRNSTVSGHSIAGVEADPGA